METTKDKPKQTVDQLNIWYSASSGGWVTCALIPQFKDPYARDKLYKKERVVHPSYKHAMKFVEQSYTGVY